ncbi:MAG: putative chaperone of endosialidase [Prokaryotic dsDNA virus sp.]|nr:MAG: putative chaperone of endosialidase [Prokaryotic dsDNA virus sp.]|tara:strand:+ start:2696 stop:3934 length:1239 start_codon:yes stop_codon:yes gene_type:complete
MANKKFSEFTLKTSTSNVDFLVGYDGSDNVRIAPSNVGGGATSLNGLSDVLIDGTSNYFVNIPSGLSSNPADNTVIGNGAGNALTTGSSNTFVGHDAGAGVSGDEDNVAIGEGAFSSSNVFKGVAVGYHAGKNNNGNRNVFIGENTGYNTSSSNNTSVGNNAGRSVTASDHTSIGYQAGYSNTSGSENTNVGHASGYSNTTSSHRTSIGYYANQYITGNQNTAVGSYALRGVSGSSTGQYNTAVGYTAGEDMTTGTTNTLVGWGAGKDITTGSNNSCIGNGSAPSANDATNEITLGNSSITAIRAQVQTISALSDERDKTNIQDSNYGLDFINSLKPVTFDWNMRDGAKVGEKDLGFIAQDLQKVDDENLQLVYSNNPDRLEASYGRLIPVLVKAIQELKSEIENCQNCKNN